MHQPPALIDHDTYRLTAIADNPLYGYSETHPILVGGGEIMEGPLNERRVLNALLGPKGETVDYHRTGSFKAYGIVNAESSTAMLDKYEVSWEGLEEPKVLYSICMSPGRYWLRQALPIGRSHSAWKSWRGRKRMPMTGILTVCCRV